MLDCFATLAKTLPDSADMPKSGCAWEISGMHIPTRLLLLAIVLSTGSALGLAQDSWINGLRNGAGEWCCGIADCGIVDAASVKAKAGGFEVRGMVRYHPQISNGTGDKDRPFTRSERLDEQVPYSDVQPSRDGAYWRCKRPDGSRRCFFAPPPGS